MCFSSQMRRNKHYSKLLLMHWTCTVTEILTDVKQPPTGKGTAGRLWSMVGDCGNIDEAEEIGALVVVVGMRWLISAVQDTFLVYSAQCRQDNYTGMNLHDSRTLVSCYRSLGYSSKLPHIHWYLQNDYDNRLMAQHTILLLLRAAKCQIKKGNLQSGCCATEVQ